MTRELRTAIRWGGVEGKRLWNLNESATNSSCMVQVYGYNSYDIWLPANLYRCWGGEPDYMGSQLINYLQPLLLNTNKLTVMNISNFLQIFTLTGTPSSIDLCNYLYVVIPLYKSIQCYRVKPYPAYKGVWDFKIQEEIDLKTYKKLKPVNFLK